MASSITLNNFLIPPAWSPPSIETLNFSRNCVLVGDFFESWFRPLDSFYGQDPLRFPYSNLPSVRWWIPPSLDTSAVDALFREALPPHLGDKLGTGQIIEWEIALRRNLTQDRGINAARITSTNSDERYRQAQEWQPSYYTSVIEQPAFICAEEVCTRFNWRRMEDVNGPAVSEVTLRPPVLRDSWTFLIAERFIPPIARYNILDTNGSHDDLFCIY